MSIIDDSQCTGCEACRQICPVGCIEMIENEEGFLFPTIMSEKCIECELCKKVCPVLELMKTTEEQYD